MGLCCVGTFLGFESPNKDPATAPTSGDFTQKTSLWFVMQNVVRVPTAVGLYTTYLAYRWPLVRDPISGGDLSSVNPALLTWSASTALPMALLIGAGIPLRLVAYSGLGKNFTFKLREPDELVTTGLYRYVQHPSYTGIFTLLFANGLLFFRPDGVLRMLAPSVELSKSLWTLWLTGGMSFLCLVLVTLNKRVQEEEKMLKGVFGQKWIDWHSRTARFIPGIW